MRIVVDTNVWVSAALAPGPPRDLIEAWASQGKFDIVMCLELYDEISEVLTQREKIRRWISLDAAEKYLESIRLLIDLAPNPRVEEVGLRDSADSFVVALARQEHCEFIVTGDLDLLEWPEQRPLCIKPKEFLERIGEEGH